MATPNFIGEPECTILYSGEGDAFEKYKPVFLALGGKAVYLGAMQGMLPLATSRCSLSCGEHCSAHFRERPSAKRRSSRWKLT